MINTIFFDIGGVLLNIYPERTIKYISNLTNLSEQEVINAFPEKEHHQYERGEISDNEFYFAIKSALPNSNNLTKGEFWTSWSMLVGEETATVSIMNKLAENNSVWLLSNTNPYHIIEEQRFKLFDKITGGIYSYDVGSRKPEKEIYYKALEIAGTEAENALFIDDLIVNIEMARSLQINAIHFNSPEKLISELNNYNL